MTESFQPNLDFNAEEVEEREAFVVDLDGYEGPLHVLLALARNQKVDLLKLSITQLAEQYLAFVHEARRRNFALAADYLVMASWLAYLKSRLLLPRNEKGKGDEVPAEEMAAALAFRLQKLEAMRRAVEATRCSASCWLVFTVGERSWEMSSTAVKSPSVSKTGAAVQVSPIWLVSK